MMTLDEFNTLLDVHGADLSRWPQDKLKAALALTEQDANARAAFDGMLDFEQTLRSDSAPEVDLPALERRIMAALSEPEAAPVAAKALKQSKPAAQGWSMAYLFAPSAGLFALAVFGFVLGIQPSVQHESLMYPMYYQADQVFADDAAIYDRGIF